MATLGDFAQVHHSTLLYLFLTFCLGTIAGFQGLVARIPKEWKMALRTFSGSCYIVARGAMPAILFAILHKLRLLSLSLHNPFYEALVLGAGSETFLRSRILLTFKSVPGQPATEEAKGPLDFIFWFQEFFSTERATFLLLTGEKLSAGTMTSRRCASRIW